MSEIIQLKSAEQIRDDILRALAAELGLSDEHLGSAIRTIAYAFASEVDELFYQLWRATKGFYLRTASGVALTSRAQDYGLTRRPSQAAIGFVTFTGTPASSIPFGTQVATPATVTQDEIVFSTTLAGVIGGGGTVTLPVRSQKAGEQGNVPSLAISLLKGSLAGVSTVQNSNPSLLGSEEEDDDALRSRILRTIAGLSRGTPDALYTGTVDFEVIAVTLAEDLTPSATSIGIAEDLNLLPIPTAGSLLIGAEIVTYTGLSLSRDLETGVFPSFTGCTRGALGSTAASHLAGDDVREYVDPSRSSIVQSARLVEYPTLGHVDVYIADGGISAAHSSLVDLVEKRLRGEGTPRNPGWRGAGITVDVYAAAVVAIHVTIQLVIAPSYASSAVGAAVKDAVLQYINGLSVGENAVAYKIAAAAASPLGVLNVLLLTLQGTAFNGTSQADVVIDSHEVARADASSVSVTA